MKKIARWFLGFKWIETYALRKAACAGSVSALALVAKYKFAGMVLTAFGISGDVLTGGLVTLGLAGLEAIRVSLNDKPEK